MTPPRWLRLSWPPTPQMLAAVLVAVVALGGGAWLGLRASDGSPSASTSPTSSPTSSPEPTPSASPSPSPSPTASPTPEPELACPLNGLEVEDPTYLEHPALAVQIENHPAARPVRNLGLADMVVEATVEGDITRYTGIFLCRSTEGMTGPVRSGRYYGIDLWQDLHLLPYFFGAGHEAIGRYEAAGAPFVNGITGQWPWFERWGPAAAPHNLYSDLEAARAAFETNAALQALAARVGELRPPFDFATDAEQPAGRGVGHVDIWTNAYWHFGWTWSADEERWERDEAGTPNVDAGTGEVLSATSVVVQLVQEDIFYGSHDPGGSPRRVHHLVGTGRATLYVGGHAIDLDWSRPTATDRTTWTYAANGEEVTLPPGVVWWEIVPLTTRVIETP